jgi:hypothetical protein
MQCEFHKILSLCGLDKLWKLRFRLLISQDPQVTFLEATASMKSQQTQSLVIEGQLITLNGQQHIKTSTGAMLEVVTMNDQMYVQTGPQKYQSFVLVAPQAVDVTIHSTPAKVVYYKFNEYANSCKRVGQAVAIEHAVPKGTIQLVLRDKIKRDVLIAEHAIIDGYLANLVEEIIFTFSIKPLPSLQHVVNESQIHKIPLRSVPVVVRTPRCFESKQHPQGTKPGVWGGNRNLW